MGVPYSYFNDGGIPITTDYILDEVLTVLRRRLTHQVAVKFGEGIFQAAKVQKLHFELIDNRRRDNAWELFSLSGSSSAKRGV